MTTSDSLCLSIDTTVSNENVGSSDHWEQDPDDTTTNLETFMNQLKVNLGTGVLNAAWAFSKGGILLSPIFVLILGGMIVYCTRTLLRVAKHVRSEHNRKYVSFPELHSILLKPYIGEKSKIVSMFVSVCLIICQYGCCCVYLLFTARSLVALKLQNFTEIEVVIAVLTVCIIPISLVSRLDFLSYVSILANFICCICLVGTAVGMFINGSFQSVSNVGTIANIPIMASSLVFAFEGIGSVLPMEFKAKDRKRYSPLLTTALIISFGLYLIMGILGFMLYGDKIESSITLNLPSNKFFDSVRTLYGIGILLSLFIQLYVGADTVIDIVNTEILHGEKKFYIDILIRILGVIITGLFSILVPNLGSMISLVGSITSTSLTFTLPALLDLCLINAQSYSGDIWFRFHITKNVFIIIIGIMISCSGIYASILELVNPTE